MRVFFERKVELAPNTWHYYFRPEQPLSFVPGQYIDLHLLTVRNDPRGKARTFTLTSLPTDAFLSFIVKIEQPGSIYKQTLQSLRPGDEAKIDDAMGDLVLPKGTGTPLIFIAGGIGIASYASMLRWLTERKERRNITLFYAIRNRNDLGLQTLFQIYPYTIKKSLHIAPDFIRVDQIITAAAPEALFYLSGSQRFVESLKAALEAQGIPREQIVFDFFDGYAEL